MCLASFSASSTIFCALSLALAILFLPSLELIIQPIKKKTTAAATALIIP
jgi:hypothetical protein